MQRKVLYPDGRVEEIAPSERAKRDRVKDDLPRT